MAHIPPGGFHLTEDIITGLHGDTPSIPGVVHVGDSTCVVEHVCGRAMLTRCFRDTHDASGIRLNNLLLSNVHCVALAGALKAVAVHADQEGLRDITGAESGEQRLLVAHVREAFHHQSRIKGKRLFIAPPLLAPSPHTAATTAVNAGKWIGLNVCEDSPEPPRAAVSRLRVTVGQSRMLEYV